MIKRVITTKYIAVEVDGEELRDAEILAQEEESLLMVHSEEDMQKWDIDAKIPKAWYLPLPINVQLAWQAWWDRQHPPDAADPDLQKR